MIISLMINDLFQSEKEKFADNQNHNIKSYLDGYQELMAIIKEEIGLRKTIDEKGASEIVRDLYFIDPTEESEDIFFIAGWYQALVDSKKEIENHYDINIVEKWNDFEKGKEK